MKIILTEQEIVDVLAEHVKRTRNVSIDGAQVEMRRSGFFGGKTVFSGTKFTCVYSNTSLTPSGNHYNKQEPKDIFFVVIDATAKSS